MAITTSIYKGKEELTMAQYEALTSIDENTDYNITDYPNVGITNFQMIFALTCQRLFQAGESFVCSDDGTYKIGHTYMITESNGTKSWLDITPQPGSFEYITIDQPSSATSGTLQAAQLTTLQASDDNYIIFNNELYRLNDKQTNMGYLVYSHVGEDSTHNFYIKCITITLSTLAWSLTSIMLLGGST